MLDAVRYVAELYFDESSVPHNEQPRFVMIMGGPAVGKTTVRKKYFSSGYVLVDAAEIFLRLCGDESIPFPTVFESPMNMVGTMVASRAISERRHIVTELIGADVEPTKQLIAAMRAIGYEISMEAIACDPEEAWRRNLGRGEDNISCYYAEPYQRSWLLAAAIALKNWGDEKA